MHLVTFLLEDAVKKNEDLLHVKGWIQAAFLYAGVWSYGGALNNASREKFDVFYKSLWQGNSKLERKTIR